MGEIVIETVGSSEIQAGLKAVDAAVDGDGRILDDVEMRLGAERVCRDAFEFCDETLSLARNKGFSVPTLAQIMAPDSAATAQLLKRVRRYFGVMATGRDMLLEEDPAILDPTHPAMDEAPPSVIEEVARRAATALASPKQAVRIRATGILVSVAERAASSGLVRALLASVGRDFSVGDRDDMGIAEALGAVARSKLPLGAKKAAVSRLMKLATSANRAVKLGAIYALYHFFANVAPADDAEALIAFLDAAAKNGSAATRTTALEGMSGLCWNTEATEDQMARVAEIAISALGDRNIGVVREAADAVASVILRGLNRATHAKGLHALRAMMADASAERRRIGTERLASLASDATGVLPREVRLDIAATLAGALADSDDVGVRGYAAAGLASLYRNNVLTAASDETITSLILLLRNDEDLFRNSAREILEIILSRGPEAQRARIASALERTKPSPAPEVLSVAKTGRRGEFPRSWRYVLSVRCPEVPEGSATVVPMIHGWKQRRGTIKGKTASAVVFIDERNPQSSAALKFYDTAGTFLGETASFLIDNPDNREMEP